MTDIIDRLTHDLEQPLHPDRIKKHPHNRQLYLEAGDVVRELNAVFGPLGWSDRRVDLQMVSQAQAPIGKDGKDGWAVVYTATWEITVHALGDPGRPLRTVQGVGTGAGYLPQIGDAHDSAAKSAESDALKRAARKLGWRFGLALYMWSPGEGGRLKEDQARAWWQEMGWVGEPVPRAGGPAQAVPAHPTTPSAPSWYGASGVDDRMAAAAECVVWVLAQTGDPCAAGEALRLYPELVVAVAAPEQPTAPATLEQRGALLEYVREAVTPTGGEGPTNQQIGQMVVGWVGRQLSPAAPMNVEDLARAALACWTAYGPGRNVAGLTACVDRALRGVGHAAD